MVSIKQKELYTYDCLQVLCVLKGYTVFAQVDFCSLYTVHITLHSNDSLESHFAARTSIT